MPWKVSCRMSERMAFLARLKNGERMTDLCKEFGISRKTGYKLKVRFERLGARGLEDQPRGTQRIVHRTTPQIQQLIVETRQQHPTWGPRKIKAWLTIQQPEVVLPASSTIGDV